MSIIKGLKDINEALDKPRGHSASGPRVRWLKLEDGQSVKIRFVNELDEDSKHYNDKNGLAIVVKEHTNPKDYRRKALDTMDSEGRDWAEEMHRKDPKAGWAGRLRFYINVLVDDPQPSPEIRIAFDKVIASEREKEAAINYAESYRIKKVGEAKAEAESIQLKSQAYIQSRAEIAQLIKEKLNITDDELLKLIAGIDYRDALRDISKSGSLIVVPHNFSDVQSGILTAEILKKQKS